MKTFHRHNYHPAFLDKVSKCASLILLFVKAWASVVIMDDVLCFGQIVAWVYLLFIIASLKFVALCRVSTADVLKNDSYKWDACLPGSCLLLMAMNACASHVCVVHEVTCRTFSFSRVCHSDVDPFWADFLVSVELLQHHAGCVAHQWFHVLSRLLIFVWCISIHFIRHVLKSWRSVFWQIKWMQISENVVVTATHLLDGMLAADLG